MNVNHLIDAIVRQTTVLIAQLATSAGARAPLAHVANQVFLDLTNELRSQGLGQKVIADMFGMALRTYHARLQRLSESATDRGTSLWEAILVHVQRNGRVTRADLLRRFRNDDEATVRGVLRDLIESGVVLREGRGDATVYVAAEPTEAGSFAGSAHDASLEALVWVSIHRNGPLSREDLADLLRVEAASIEPVLSVLLATERVEVEGELLRSRECVIAYEDELGWEAAVLDHYHAMVAAIGTKLQRRERRALPADAIGGSTWVFDMRPDHPLRDEVTALLREVRERASALRARVDAENERLQDGPRTRVIFYAGQTVIEEEDDA